MFKWYESPKPVMDKASTVKLAATKFLTDLYNSVDGELKELLINETFLAGGCFASIYHAEKPNDYDIFFRSKEAVDKFKVLCPHFCFNNKTTLSEYRSLTYISSATTQNAFSLNLPKFKIQFITRFYGTPEEIINTFDFHHSQAYLDLKNDSFHIPINNIKHKVLTYNQEGNDFPLSTLNRILKFKERGYSISFLEIIKISMSLNRYNLLDPKVLHEQLIGFYETELLEDLIKNTKLITQKKFRNKLDGIVND